MNGDNSEGKLSLTFHNIGDWIGKPVLVVLRLRMKRYFLFWKRVVADGLTGLLNAITEDGVFIDNCFFIPSKTIYYIFQIYDDEDEESDSSNKDEADPTETNGNIDEIDSPPVRELNLGKLS